LLTALLSDIHGSLDALTACLRRARDRGAEVLWVMAQTRAPWSKLSPGMPPRGRSFSGVTTTKPSKRAAAISTTRRGPRSNGHDRRLARSRDASWRSCHSSYARERSATLTLRRRRRNTGDYIDSPAAAKRCADAADAAYTFCGHVHDPGPVFRQRPRPDERVPALPGDRDPGAQSSPLGGNRRFGGSTARSQSSGAYMLFDPERQTLTFLRVPYDAAAAGISSTRRACGIG
jgi:hypothetical protein